MLLCIIWRKNEARGVSLNPCWNFMSCWLKVSFFMWILRNPLNLLKGATLSRWILIVFLLRNNYNIFNDAFISHIVILGSNNHRIKFQWDLSTIKEKYPFRFYFFWTHRFKYITNVFWYNNHKRCEIFRLANKHK